MDAHKWELAVFFFVALVSFSSVADAAWIFVFAFAERGYEQKEITAHLLKLIQLYKRCSII